MGEKLLLNKAAKIAVEDIVQKVMDIFEAEDGRVFEEKKKEVIEISLCSITVNPSIPNVSIGRSHKIRERVIATVNFIHLATV